MDLFTPKAPAVIGLDIDNSSVKMVELTKKKSGYCLERYAIVNLSLGVFDDGQVHDANALNQALSDCKDKLGSRLKNAAAAIPYSGIVTKRIEVPDGIREEELLVQIMDEVNRLTGNPPDQSSVDYKFDKHFPGEAGQPGTSEVLIFACNKERVEQRSLLVEAAGFKPSVIDSDQLALLDAVTQSFERQWELSTKDIVLIIDIGSNITNFYFFNKESGIVFTRSNAFGTHQITQEIAMTYGVSDSEANKIRLNHKESSSEKFESISRNFIESVAQEAQRAVQLFYTSSNYSSIHSFCILGTGVKIPSMSETVSNALEVEGHVLNPFAGMEISSSINHKALTIDAPSLSVACGLAFRRFDK